MCAAVIPHLTEQKSGKIVNISSIVGRAAFPFFEVGQVIYGCMKAGLIRYTQLLADRLGPDGINVNCVCPGLVYTDANRANVEWEVANTPEYKGYDPQQL